MKLINYKDLTLYEKIYLYINTFISKEEYLDELYNLIGKGYLKKENLDIINLIDDVQQNGAYANELLNYQITEEEYYKIKAKIIYLLSSECDFNHFETIIELEKQIGFEFDATYFMHNCAVKRLCTRNGKLITEVTGNKEKDMKAVLDYYKRYAGL